MPVLGVQGLCSRIFAGRMSTVKEADAVEQKTVDPVVVGSSQSINEKRQDGGIILIPQPSDNPNDPLVSFLCPTNFFCDDC